jgi:hypothetical protein
VTTHSATLDSFRRSGTAYRALTRAPIVPSQDVSRYQAKDMPPPIYDLDHEEGFFRALLVPALAVVTTGAGIVLIQLIGAWLAPLGQ